MIRPEPDSLTPLILTNKHMKLDLKFLEKFTCLKNLIDVRNHMQHDTTLRQQLSISKTQEIAIDISPNDNSYGPYDLQLQDSNL
jgi:hypothetical protein